MSRKCLTPPVLALSNLNRKWILGADMPGPKKRITIAARNGVVRASYRGEVLAESYRALVLSEEGYPPRVYFPSSDVRMSLLCPSERKTHCPHKGDAAYWSYNAAGRDIGDVAWGYPDPAPDVSMIAGHISFAEPVEVGP